MNFELSQDHKVLRDAVRDFVENEIKPLAARPHPFEYELYFGV
jgi:butyryl-CoA dehydrogenase